MLTSEIYGAYVERGILVKVTHEDIAESRMHCKSESSCTECPIAQSLTRSQERFPKHLRKSVEVDSAEHICIGATWYHPRPNELAKVSEFIGDFDRGAKVEPIEFWIEEDAE